MTTKPAMNVYQAIAAVQAEIAQTGISKDRRNTAQGYAFRGIDDVYAAMSPLLAKHGLCIIPRVIDRIEVERETSKGGLALYVTVHAEFDFVSAADGSKHTAATFGEAMDTADKATNKAMSAAYKYAAFMTFAIPTEGDNDADAHTHDVQPRDEPRPSQAITAGQLTELQKLADEINADLPAFCGALGIASLAELPGSKYAAAKAKFEQRKADKAKETLDDEIPYRKA